MVTSTCVIFGGIGFYMFWTMLVRVNFIKKNYCVFSSFLDFEFTYFFCYIRLTYKSIE